MSAIGLEMYKGMSATNTDVRDVAALAMSALCADVPEHIVPPEYAHFRNTALEFVADHFATAGVAASTIQRGMDYAVARYDKHQ